MSEIKVISQSQKIVVDSSSNSISIINTGPIGPPGPGVSQNVDGGSASETFLSGYDIDGGNA